MALEHLCYFSPETLAGLLEDNGFKVKKAFSNRPLGSVSGGARVFSLAIILLASYYFIRGNYLIGLPPDRPQYSATSSRRLPLLSLSS